MLLVFWRSRWVLIARSFIVLKLDLLLQHQETICKEPSEKKQDTLCLPGLLTSVIPLCVFVYVCVRGGRILPWCQSLFSGVKGHPYSAVLTIYRQMGPLRSKPLALFVLSWWWNIDRKIEIFCLLLNLGRLKGLMSMRTSLSPVTAKCNSTTHQHWLV